MKMIAINKHSSKIEILKMPNAPFLIRYAAC